MSIADKLSLALRRKVPLVLQTEASECGLASLTMVAQYFGYRADLPHLRRRFGMSLKGATLKDVMRVADQIGLACRPLRLELSEIPRLRLPCVLHWDLNHFVVLERVEARELLASDQIGSIVDLLQPYLVPKQRWRDSKPPAGRAVG